MKILHYQHNGVGVILAAAQRELGFESRVLSTASHPFGFAEDFVLPQRRRREWLQAQLDWRPYYSYDVFHNHDTAVPKQAARRWRKAIVQHYHDPNTVAPYNDAPLAFLSLPGIKKVVPQGIWIPLPSKTDVFTPATRRPDERVRVGFSGQTIDPKKGAMIPKDQVLAAVARAGGKAVPCPLEGLHDHAQMIEYYNGIDIWVDRMGCDFYGFAAVEVAAMGIPVITQIGEYEREFVPGCPFISAGWDTVESAVYELIMDDDARADRGARARDFAVAVHDARKVALECTRHYRDLLEGR